MALLKSLIAWVVTKAASQFLPADWIKRQLTTIITSLLVRVFDVLDKAAASTEFTDLDDKAVREARNVVMAEGVIANFVAYVYSLLFDVPAPAPVDPVNPPDVPLDPVAPAGPGILKRILARIRKAW